MNRTLVIAAAALLALGLIACSDDDTAVVGETNTNTGGTATNSGNGGTTTEPPAGAAYEAKVEVSGGPAEGTSTGSTEAAAEGQFYAVVFQGSIDIFLTTGDSGTAMIISAGIDTNGGEVPGTFTVTEGLDGTSFNATIADTTGGGILDGTGGSITVDFCPNEEGNVVAGSFNNITTVDQLTMGNGGTFNGEWRATVVQSDGSVSCPEPEPEPGTGVVDTGSGNETGGGNECGLNTNSCTGPVCPYEEFIAECTFENCTSTCSNPMEFEGCFGCLAQCEEDSGIADDAEAASLVTALNACSNNAGCDEIEDEDAYDTCVINNCCSELVSAYN
jgi:hypothetical protein